jgi:hypothetical protein
MDPVNLEFHFLQCLVIVTSGIIDLDMHASLLEDLATKANMMRSQDRSLIRST